MIREELESRKLPPLFTLESGETVKTRADWEERRAEIEDLLRREFTGYPTRLGVRTEGRVLFSDENGYGGKAVVKTIQLEIKSDFSFGTFPFRLALPKGVINPPLFLYLAFTPEIADGLGEEILDAGYGIASVYYQDMAPDYFDEHKNGLGRFCARNPYDSWGKLAIWAWGASRMLDYLLQKEAVDAARIAVMGHSRLGKTALAAGCFDERFSLTVSNDSGGGGAALFRKKGGEQIENLYGKGSRLWFCGNFFSYLNRTEELPFDQHFLLALAAPRHLYVCSASQDTWADPKAEFLACAGASPVYGLFGLPGLVTEDAWPECHRPLHEGYIGYHMREGAHYLGRYDWQQVIAYRNRWGV